MTAVTWPDHDREFECAVSHHGAELGRVRGKSKKEAKSQAALDVLRHLPPKPEAAPEEAGWWRRSQPSTRRSSPANLLNP